MEIARSYKEKCQTASSYSSAYLLISHRNLLYSMIYLKPMGRCVVLSKRGKIKSDMLARAARRRIRPQKLLLLCTPGDEAVTFVPPIQSLLGTSCVAAAL